MWTLERVSRASPEAADQKLIYLQCCRLLSVLLHICTNYTYLYKLIISVLQAPRIPDAADDCRSPSISGTGNRWCTSEEAKEEIPDDVPAPEGGAEEIGRNEGSAGLPPSTVEEQVAKPLTGRAALEVIAARLGAQLNGEQRLAVQRCAAESIGSHGYFPSQLSFDRLVSPTGICHHAVNLITV